MVLCPYVMPGTNVVYGGTRAPVAVLVVHSGSTKAGMASAIALRAHYAMPADFADLLVQYLAVLSPAGSIRLSSYTSARRCPILT
eukprot:1132650-Rhodomonas_salina.2